MDVVTDSWNSVGMGVSNDLDGARLGDGCGLRQVLDVGGSHLKVGVSGDEIDRIVHQATIDRGG